MNTFLQAYALVGLTIALFSWFSARHNRYEREAFPVQAAMTCICVILWPAAVLYIGTAKDGDIHV